MDYTLVTTIVARHHLRILEDWLEFLVIPPKAINVLLADDPALKEEVAHFCENRSISFEPSRESFDHKAREGETTTLLAQMRRISTQWVLVVRLDTFPFRLGHDLWLRDVGVALKEKNLPFMTGTTRPYRADLPTTDKRFLLTQRLSNNMLLINSDFWLTTIENALSKNEVRTRYFTEGAIESACFESDVWGLRLRNKPTWRVFHTQVWGQEQTALREAFRAGYRVEWYMRGYEDDQRYEWTRYYLSETPSLIKRARIHLGFIRRKLMNAAR